VPIVYPENLSATAGTALGIAVVATNCLVYAWALRRRRG